MITEDLNDSTVATVSSNNPEPLDEVLRGCQNPMIIGFFTEHPPLPGEFIIDFLVSRVRPTVVTTTQRLWMFDQKQCEYVTLTISEIAKMTVSRGSSSCTATVRFKDGQDRTLENLEDAPSSADIARAIKRCIPEKRRRGFLLTLFLGYNLVSFTWNFISLLINPEGGKVTELMDLFFITALIAVFSWRLWGIYLFYASALVTLLMRLSDGDATGLPIVLAVIPLTIFTALLMPVWKWFK